MSWAGLRRYYSVEIVAKQSAREFSLTPATSKMAARPHLDKGHLALNV